MDKKDILTVYPLNDLVDYERDGTMVAVESTTIKLNNLFKGRSRFENRCIDPHPYHNRIAYCTKHIITMYWG